MRVAIGSDHRGFEAKEHIKRVLMQMGHEVTDYGTNNDSSTDYPDYAIPVCQAIQAGKAERGLLLCGSGIGMSMVANKMKGIRAALCHDELTSEMSRRHNDANVLCLASDLLGDELMRRVVEIWMVTAFDAGRHERRVKKIMKVESLEALQPEPKEKPLAAAAHSKAGKAAKKS
jgi:ribose 5-phosphate isomerase B